MGGRENPDLRQFADGIAGERIYFFDAFNSVAQLHAPGGLGVGGEDVQVGPAQAEPAAGELHLVALVIYTDQETRQFFPVGLLSALYVQRQPGEIIRRADIVNGGNRCHHQSVRPGQYGGGGLQPQLVYVLVDGRVFLYIGIGGGQVRLGLVVVVIGDEEFHRVLGEEGLELPVELGGQHLVGRNYQRGPLQALYGCGHRIGLARAGDAQQGLVGLAGQHSGAQGVYGSRLVAGGLIGRN